jgi:chromosome segregation ATPase
MPTKSKTAKLEEEKTALETELLEKTAAIKEIREQLGEMAAELHVARKQLDEAQKSAEQAQEELGRRTAISTEDGTPIEMASTLVLAETGALTHWVSKASATWAVDFEGESSAVNFISHAIATNRERLEQLPDGTWRMHCANRNAAMRMESMGRARQAAETKARGKEFDLTIKAVPTRSMAMTAKDASRATGVGRFHLGSYQSLSFLGPTKVYVRDNGDVVIRTRQQ